MELPKEYQIFRDFVEEHPDFYEYKEKMLEFIKWYPQFDHPIYVAEVYKFAKYYPEPYDKTNLDSILGLE